MGERGAQVTRVPRPARQGDRAAYHAELVDLTRLSWAPTLSSIMSGNAWHELDARLVIARENLGSRTAVRAACRVLAVLAALNKAGARGYRGVIAPVAELAETVRRCTGEPCSERTAWGALSILEAAGLVERGLAGRGTAERVGRGWARRRVLVLTLTTAAISAWSRGSGGRLSHTSDLSLHTANFAGNPMDESPASGRNSRRTREQVNETTENELAPCLEATANDSARPSTSPSSLIAGLGHTLGAVPAPQGRGAPVGAASSQASRGRAPERLITGRPRPSEPATRANAVRCLVYDLETALRHRAVSSAELRDSVARVVEQAGPFYRGETDQPWETWVWSWRQLDQAERTRALSSAVLPAVRAGLKRAWVGRFPADETYSRPPILGMLHQEPGPRARPSPPAPKPPPTAPPEPGQMPAWLAEFVAKKVASGDMEAPHGP